MGNRTLKGMLTQFVVMEIFHAITAIVLLLVMVLGSQTIGLTYPANYPENYLSEIENSLGEGDIQLADIPMIYDAQIEDKAGTVLETTMKEEEQRFVQESKETGNASNNRLFNGRTYVYLEGATQNLALSYQIASDFISPTLRNFLPTADVVFIVIALIIWIIGFLLIIRYYAKRVNQELKKIMATNEEIRQMNLDFEVPKSKLKEINDVLLSLDTMKLELAASLQEQWSVKKQQEDTLQALTHDIRTPITLIGGNLELLEETTLDEEQIDLVQHLDNGVQRLQQYIDELKELSGLAAQSSTKGPVSQALLTQWATLASGIAKQKEISVIIEKEEASTLNVNSHEIAKAFQNIVQNAVDYSPADSTILLSFEDSQIDYRITVTDAGEGFSPEALSQATQRFYTSADDRGQGHFGLGLAIASEIMEKNNGYVKLENHMIDGNLVGGKVSLILNKT